MTEERRIFWRGTAQRARPSYNPLRSGEDTIYKVTTHIKVRGMSVLDPPDNQLANIQSYIADQIKKSKKMVCEKKERVTHTTLYVRNSRNFFCKSRKSEWKRRLHLNRRALHHLNAC